MVVEIIAEWAVQVISAGGYFWVFFLMILESMIFPIPSEAVMPLAGYLIAEGGFTFLGVIFFSTLGSIVGSLISYYIGMYGGRKFVHKFGKYFLLDEEHLNWTESFFKRHGQKTIFISRLLPVVRHLISLPAGMGKMPLKRFIIYTILGAGIWNTFLAWLGYYFSDKWQMIHEYSKPLDYVAIVFLVVCVIWWIAKHIKRKRKIKKGKK